MLQLAQIEVETCRRNVCAFRKKERNQISAQPVGVGNTSTSALSCSARSYFGCIPTQISTHTHVGAVHSGISVFYSTKVAGERNKIKRWCVCNVVPQPSGRWHLMFFLFFCRKEMFFISYLHDVHTDPFQLLEEWNSKGCARRKTEQSATSILVCTKSNMRTGPPRGVQSFHRHPPASHTHHLKLETGDLFSSLPIWKGGKNRMILLAFFC